MPTVDKPSFSYDPYSPEAMSDPLPFYRILRDRHPVYWLEEYDAWAISRFEDVYSVLADPDGHFVATNHTVIGRSGLASLERGAIRRPSLDPLESFNRLDDPQYGEVRQAMGAPFRPRAASRLEPFVREQARQLLDELAPRRSFDVVAEYGGQVAARTMCWLFGLPLERAAELLQAVNGMAHMDSVTGNFTEDRLHFAERWMAVAHEAVERRRAAGADGSVPAIDGLIHHEFDGRRLSDSELAPQVGLVLVGGSETLPKVVGHGLLELQRHPVQREEVGADPDRLKTALEEMIRFCAPAQFFLRTVRKPIEIGGKQLRPGQRVLPLNMSANRDEREFEAPDEFRWNRVMERHLSFGQGMKFCLGTHVARLEGRVLLEELIRRIPRYAIDEATAQRPPSSFQWGYDHLTLHTDTKD
ncbi:cytochrome P450 [Streptomyces sp. NPDC008092]|uniref:cytochrome P450 n=1 Tax=Streptomyces sp. NPDC008092 TaxID=3364808 RepID=UPI0036EC459F